MYYFLHNSRGDITGVYNSSGVLRARYNYDSWGNVTVTDASGNVITDENHIGNLNKIRYRGYYQDTETGLYYLMSRYYDPQTHRFVNADGYFATGQGILDTNMNIYCMNNPINYCDPTGKISSYAMQLDMVNNPKSKYTLKDVINKMYEEYFLSQNFYYAARNKNKGWKSRKDKRHGSEDRQPSGSRERNVAHPNGEEHSRVPKGNRGVRIEAFNKDKHIPLSEIYKTDITKLFDIPQMYPHNDGAPIYAPNTGDKPIYEKVWDEIIHMFD